MFAVAYLFYYFQPCFNWNTPLALLQVVHYTPKAAIFDFYTEVKMVVEPNGHEVVIGKCGTCSQTIRGSRNVTSNFVTHVKVCTFPAVLLETARYLFPAVSMLAFHVKGTALGLHSSASWSWNDSFDASKIIVLYATRLKSERKFDVEFIMCVECLTLLYAARATRLVFEYILFLAGMEIRARDFYSA